MLSVEAKEALQETEQILSEFPQIAGDLQSFVRQQAKLAAWRERRYGDKTEARAIVEAAKQRAAQSEVSRDEAIGRVIDATTAINEELAAKS